MKFLEFKKTGAAVHDVVIGGSWSYSLDFKKMTQMNKKSRAVKKIKREGPSPDLSAPGFRKPKPAMRPMPKIIFGTAEKAPSTIWKFAPSVVAFHFRKICTLKKQS